MVKIIRKVPTEPAQKVGYGGGRGRGAGHDVGKGGLWNKSWSQVCPIPLPPTPLNMQTQAEPEEF